MSHLHVDVGERQGLSAWRGSTRLHFLLSAPALLGKNIHPVMRYCFLHPHHLKKRHKTLEIKAKHSNKIRKELLGLINLWN